MELSDEQAQFEIARLAAREEQERVRGRLLSDYRVFISYSHADAPLAQRLRQVFDERGITFAIDEKDIDAGDRINDEVKDLIRGSTDYVLILSKFSANSAWCSYEYGLADANDRRVFLFISDSGVSIPSYASGRVVVRELKDLANRFADARIDAADVDEFIGEILDVRLERLAVFVPREGAPHACWDAPDGAGIEDREPSLTSIELDVGDQRLSLDYGKLGHRISQYQLIHSRELNAVVVAPRKEGSSSVGVREEREGGPALLHPGGSSVKDKLLGNAIYGWPAHQDFWTRTLERLDALLRG